MRFLPLRKWKTSIGSVGYKLTRCEWRKIELRCTYFEPKRFLIGGRKMVTVDHLNGRSVTQTNMIVARKINGSNLLQANESNVIMIIGHQIVKLII